MHSRASLCFIIVIAEFIDNVKYFFQKMTEKEMGGSGWKAGCWALKTRKVRNRQITAS